MSDLDQYDYHLPPELIAKRPLRERDESRLLVVERASGDITQHSIRELPSLLRAGDSLVFNDTRVIPARLLGTRVATGARWEGLFLDSPQPGTWRLIGRTRGRLRSGEQIEVRPAHGSAPAVAAERLRLTLVE